MTKIKSIEDLKDSLIELASCNWKDSQARASLIISKLDEPIFKEVFYSQEVFDVATQGVNYWQANAFMLKAIRKFSNLSDDLIKNSNVSTAICAVIENGLYSDISILDYIVKNRAGEEQVLASKYCSIEALRGLTDSKNSKVRKIAYERLGPVECLGEMITDKKADIREMGIKMAPIGYSGLNSLTKEIARGPFSLLVRKISGEYLPMLMANRNLKSKWITNLLEERLNSEGEKDE